jgi:hypothetical protein
MRGGSTGSVLRSMAELPAEAVLSYDADVTCMSRRGVVPKPRVCLPSQETFEDQRPACDIKASVCLRLPSSDQPRDCHDSTQSF